jgi:hypothetical protein
MSSKYSVLEGLEVENLVFNHAIVVSLLDGCLLRVALSL